jgi:hypothetical protein
MIPTGLVLEAMMVEATAEDMKGEDTEGEDMERVMVEGTVEGTAEVMVA